MGPYLRGTADYTGNYGSSVMTAHRLASINARKIKRISKQVRLNKGELKCNQFAGTTAAIGAGTATAFHITDIGQGDNIAQREGHVIHVYGYEIRIVSSNPVLDNYVILSKDAIAPDVNTVHTQRGGFIDNDSKDNYKEVAYLRNYGADADSTSSNNGQMSYHNKRFKNPLKVQYSGVIGSTIVKNGLFFLFVNNGSVSHTVTYNVRLWYRDH